MNNLAVLLYKDIIFSNILNIAVLFGKQFSTKVYCQNLIVYRSQIFGNFSDVFKNVEIFLNKFDRKLYCRGTIGKI